MQVVFKEFLGKRLKKCKGRPALFSCNPGIGFWWTFKIDLHLAHVDLESKSYSLENIVVNGLRDFEDEWTKQRKLKNSWKCLAAIF